MIRLTGAALALTFAALAAGAPAYAADDEKKPVDTQPPPAEKLPDRARPNFTPTPGQASAIKAIQSHVSEWVAKNGTKYSFATSFDSDRGQIVIDSDAPRDLLASLAKTDDAEAQEAVAKAEFNETRTEDTWHRRDDVQAFWGGAGVSNGSGICSAGYAVRSAGGAVYSVTAGHCFSNGTNALTESLARSYGIVSGRRLPTVTGHPMDMELMGGRLYGGRVYTGGVFSTTGRGVANAGAAYAGYTNYCHSGRTTGENCGHTALDTNAQVCTQTGCKSPVIKFVGGNMIQPGDSGGAFYAIDSSGRAWIRGNTIASGGGVGYAQPYTTVAAQYGISIVTG
jgi:hypothetical protein